MSKHHFRLWESMMCIKLIISCRPTVVIAEVTRATESAIFYYSEYNHSTTNSFTLSYFPGAGEEKPSCLGSRAVEALTPNRFRKC